MAFRKVSRQVAHAEGIKRFYTGEPCIRGHDAERFVANGNCVDCASWKTPPKRNKVGVNTAIPCRPLVFNVKDYRPLPEEMQAAFFYMEANHWHDAALQAVHNDPALLERYAPIPSDEETRKAQAIVDGRNRVLQRIHAELASSETVNPSTPPVEPTE